ncbi:NOS3 protein, partial [Eurystomus gularis]|nr:NOS3 protein [Eurystomus gularis]
QDARLYEEWKWFRCPTLLEVLEEFPSVGLPPALLLTQLPLLQPRYYSISSAPGPSPGEIHLTVAVVTYHSESERGRRPGGSPGHLQGPQSIPLVPRESPASSGASPGSQSTPWAPCGGCSLPTGGPLGSMVLVFGCRSAALDHIYREEMEEAREQGALSQVLTAFSRQPGTPK